MFAQLGLLKRLTGLLYFPITPTFPHFGLLGMLGYLPAKFKLRFLEPIRFDDEGMHEDKALVQTVAHEIRAPDPGEPLGHARRAQVGVVRMTMDSRRILVTGLSTYWGGRLAQALEALREVEAIIGVDNEEPDGRARAHRVREGRAPSTRCCAASSRRPRSTRWSTRAWWSTRPPPSPRKAHENNVIGTMNILAACSGRRLARAQGRLQVLGALLRLRAGRPGLLRRVDGPAAPAAHADRARHRRGRGVGRRVRREEPRRGRTVLRFANVLGPDVRTSHIGLFSLPAVPMILGFDPRYQFVHEDDVVHALEHAVTQRRCPASTTWPATACSRSARWPGCSASPTRRSCRPGARAWPRRRSGASGCASRPRRSTSCASAAGSTTAATRRPASATATRAARPCMKLGEHLRLHPLVRGAQRAVPLRARGGGLPALEPARQERARKRSARSAATSWSSCSAAVGYAAAPTLGRGARCGAERAAEKAVHGQEAAAGRRARR